MNIHPLASSSDANCTVVSTDSTTILIDAGIPLKMVKPYVKKLDAVFVSHEHIDHWKGSGPITRFFKCPLYMSHESFSLKASRIGTVQHIDVAVSDTVIVNDLTITHFTTRHDAKMSFGYCIKEQDGPTFTYVTDTGILTPLIKKFLLESDIILLESNYDDDMLDEYEEYAEWLKSRVRSQFGHLSNEQAIGFLRECKNKYDKVIFGHLSKRTNTPEAVLSLARKYFPDGKFYIAPLKTPIEVTKT